MDSSLETRTLDLIDQAAPGATLRMATYRLDSTQIKEALIEAATQRSVDVRVVAENSGHSPQLDQLSAALGPGRVVLCDLGCNSPTNADIMHHKFMVVSELADGRTDVVAQSSQNLDGDYGKHQNLLISYGDAGLAAGYRAVFDKLASQQDHTWTTPFTSTSGKVTVWMTPRSAASDPILDAVNAVACPGSIRIAHSQFSTERLDLINALGAKRGAGCTVQVIVPEGNQTVAVAVKLAEKGIVTFSYRPGGCHYPLAGTCGHANLHSKIMLTESATGERLVYTGSHNLIGGSLTWSDDSIVRVNDAAVWAAYDADYRAMHNELIQLVPAAYPAAALQMAANGPQDQRAPRAAAVRDGYTAVTWESGNEVYARIYRDGAPVTGPVKVSMGGVGCASGFDHRQPAVGVDSAGTAYLAWSEDGDCRGEHNIAVRTLSATGTLGATIWANAPEWGGDQTRPRIAVTGAGAFTVVWEDGATGTVRAARYASPASRTFGPVAVGTGTRPDVAVDHAGAATVAWQETQHVYGKRLSPTGATLAGRTRLSVNAAAQHLAPAVAVTGAGDSVVAWSDNLDGVWRVRVRGFTPALAQRFAERPVAVGVNGKGADADPTYEYPPLCDGAVCAVQGSPSIAVDDSGRFVTGWTETDIWNSGRGQEVYARGFNADGSTAGRFPAIRMNPNTAGHQFGTAVAAGTPGFTYFYTEDFDVNGYADIVARTGFTNTAY
ncbi:phospholipase D-like domain-containing protein [Nonomuraea sp. NPDC050310]|uniref:phospholipase D-like domain-containing protein n=1 Tax=Nonomuraea sp. NPDC050310 TaxID=3154935 RepID=UPI0033D2785A